MGCQLEEKIKGAQTAISGTQPRTKIKAHALVSRGCPNKKPQTGCHQQRTFIFSTLWGLERQGWGPAGLGVQLFQAPGLPTVRSRGALREGGLSRVRSRKDSSSGSGFAL